LRVRVEGQLTVNSLALRRNAALDGQGLSYLPEPFVRADIACGALIPVLRDWCPVFPGYHLYYPSRRQNSAAFALVMQTLRHRA
jgi:DNA-binding transcriptional LysR family regulator